MKNFNPKLVDQALRIDPWLSVFFGFLKTKLSAAEKKSKPKKILICELHLLGDIVMVTVLLKYLRRYYPKSHIGLVAGPWAETVLSNHPDLYDSFYSVIVPWVRKNNLLLDLFGLIKCVVKLRDHKWDWAIEPRGDLRQIFLLRLAGAKRRFGYDFTGGGWLLTDKIPDDGSNKHIVDHHIQILEYISSNSDMNSAFPSLWLSDEEMVEVKGSAPKIGLHFGASLPLRRLPKEKALELLSSILIKYTEPIVIYHTEEVDALIKFIMSNLDCDYKERVTVRSFLLREFIVDVAKCSLFIGMDSAGGHIAAALNVPVLSIFGPAMELSCKPIGKNVEVISLDHSFVPCRPCDQRVCTNSEYQYCFKGINWNEVIK